ncbi:MAG TPA: hypothetical protein VK168_14725 [Saprospiraceae bacterium]|nr:hypothetical protein [Saprospiraceae bacterium]
MEPMFNADQDLAASQTVMDQQVSEVDAVAKAQHARRFQRGIKWMLGGAGMLVFSFGLNFLLFQSGADFEIPMYVLTSAGALAALKGMADIFGV